MATTHHNQSLDGLVQLAHHRWNIPVLAELQRRSGAKYVALAHALNISRGSLTASLNDLVDLELVRRNTGHGHPLRPEYLLTETGQRVGEHCLSIASAIAQRREQQLAYRKWTLPLVAALGSEVRRFNEVRDRLPDATPRAIALGLKALTASHWAERSIVDDYPPAAGYTLMPKGQQILTSVKALV